MSKQSFEHGVALYSARWAFRPKARSSRKVVCAFHMLYIYILTRHFVRSMDIIPAPHWKHESSHTHPFPTLEPSMLMFQAAYEVSSRKSGRNDIRTDFRWLRRRCTGWCRSQVFGIVRLTFESDHQAGFRPTQSQESLQWGRKYGPGRLRWVDGEDQGFSAQLMKVP